MIVTPDGDSQVVIELSQKGYCCSQIVVALALRRQNKTNWDLIRAMEGLKGGLGYSGGTCGTLTGAVCLMGLYAGRGPVDEKPDSRLDQMFMALMGWFRGEIGSRSGGVTCEEITTNNAEHGLLQTCQSIMLKTYLKSIEILEAYEFKLDKGRD